MPNTLNSGRQEKKGIFYVMRKLQKCDPYIGNQGVFCLWIQKVCFLGIQHIY